jgi:hypothetical protein
MTPFESIESDELAIIATFIALAASKVLNTEELNVYGNFLVAIGSVALTIAAQDQALKTSQEKSNNKEKKTDMQQQIHELQEQVRQILEGKIKA